jgi:hypothetical protein
MRQISRLTKQTFRTRLIHTRPFHIKTSPK